MQLSSVDNENRSIRSHKSRLSSLRPNYIPYQKSHVMFKNQIGTSSKLGMIPIGAELDTPDENISNNENLNFKEMSKIID